MKRCVDALSVFTNNKYCNCLKTKKEMLLRELLEIFTKNRFSMAFSLLLFFMPMFSDMTLRYEKLKKTSTRQEKDAEAKNRRINQAKERELEIEKLRSIINDVGDNGMKEELLVKALKNLT